MSSSQGSYVEVKTVPGNPNIYEIKNIDNQSQINDILSRKNDAEVKAQRTFSDRASELGSRVGSYLPAMPQMPWDSYNKDFVRTSTGDPSNPTLLTDVPRSSVQASQQGPLLTQSPENLDNRPDLNPSGQNILDSDLGGGSSKKHKTRKRKRQKKTKKKTNRKSKIGKRRNHKKSKKYNKVI